ncbi:MAG: histone [Candidatus Woesearchaeota archaeon]
MDKNIPRNAIRTLLKDMGAIRVSEKAISQFIKQIEQTTQDIGQRSLKYMRHAKRKTVHESDIDLAIKDYENRN